MPFTPSIVLKSSRQAATLMKGVNFAFILEHFACLSVAFHFLTKQMGDILDTGLGSKPILEGKRLGCQETRILPGDKGLPGAWPGYSLTPLLQHSYLTHTHPQTSRLLHPLRHPQTLQQPMCHQSCQDWRLHQTTPSHASPPPANHNLADRQ